MSDVTEQPWFRILFFLATIFFAALFIANAVYYYRLANGKTITKGEANSMLVLNIILSIIAVILFFFAFYRLFFSPTYRKDIEKTVTTTVKSALTNPDVGLKQSDIAALAAALSLQQQQPVVVPVQPQQIIAQPVIPQPALPINNSTLAALEPSGPIATQVTRTTTINQQPQFAPIPEAVTRQTTTTIGVVPQAVPTINPQIAAYLQQQGYSAVRNIQ